MKRDVVALWLAARDPRAASVIADLRRKAASQSKPISSAGLVAVVTIWLTMAIGLTVSLFGPSR
jgi:hypothetical protein